MADDDPLPYQSLYRRYRPQRFGEVRGQDHLTGALRNAVRTDRVAHAYLFSGPRGTGKTSTARILAKALNCTDLQDGEPCGACESCVAVRAGSSLDVVELDAASNNGVDAMRDLVSRAALGSPGRRKVYIVDEVHMLSTAASNALLKTLEEPPDHVVFVLATTDPQKVLATIRSRTQPFEFRLLGPDLLHSLLADVNDRADLGLDAETLDRVARRGNGSARDALSALDQAAAAGGAEDEAHAVPGVVEGLAGRDIGAALTAVAEAVGLGRDPQRLALEVIGHLRSAFLVTMAPGLASAPEHDRSALEDQARRLGPAALVRAMEVLGTALVDMRESLDSRVTLETALIRLCVPAADVSPAALLERLEALERRGPAPAGVTAAPPVASNRPSPLPPTKVAAPAATAAAASGPVGAGPVGAGLVSGGPIGTGSAGGGAIGVGPSGGGPGSPRPTIGAMRQQPAPANSAAPKAGPPPQAPPPEPATPAAQGAVANLDRDELTRVWGDRLFPAMSSTVRARYRPGRWASVDGGQAVFLLPTQQDRDRAEEKRLEVETALAAHFGARVVIRLEVDGSPPAIPPSPAQHGGPEHAAAPSSPDGPYGSDDRYEELSSAEVAGFEVAPDVPASAETKLFEAFPGTEEVTR